VQGAWVGGCRFSISVAPAATLATAPAPAAAPAAPAAASAKTLMRFCPVRAESEASGGVFPARANVGHVGNCRSYTPGSHSSRGRGLGEGRGPGGLSTGRVFEERAVLPLCVCLFVQQSKTAILRSLEITSSKNKNRIFRALWRWGREVCPWATREGRARGGRAR